MARCRARGAAPPAPRGAARRDAAGSGARVPAARGRLARVDGLRARGRHLCGGASRRPARVAALAGRALRPGRRRARRGWPADCPDRNARRSTGRTGSRHRHELACTFTCRAYKRRRARRADRACAPRGGERYRHFPYRRRDEDAERHRGERLRPAPLGAARAHAAPRAPLRHCLPALRARGVSDRPSLCARRACRAGNRRSAEPRRMHRLKILTWHTHGAYLYYLTQAPHDFYVLSKPGRPPGYGGRCGHLPWGANVHDLPVAEAKHQRFDCIVFQDDHQYLEDQHLYLTPEQRRLPKIYIEHDPPRDSPTDARHPVDDPDVLLVHVTPFNALMWDSGRTPTRVIEHGVIAPRAPLYTGELGRGIVVVNHLARRGRRLGADVFAAAREHVPLDLVGMGAEEAGGIG